MPPDPHPTTPPGQSAGSAGFLARLRDWFDSLDDIAPGRRVAWIEAHVGDTEERDALLRLLESDANTSGFFEIPAADHLAGLPDDEAAAHESLIGTRVGAFRLVRLLGRGGMAAVFLGEREGGDFRQLAAVKLLRRGLYSELEQRLFQRERQVLASLAHPNIAHLIDGGVTAAGVPFLAMEYVDGATLLEHADARGLDARARIALMIVVCRAVEVAHRNLVVHRDIKPSNIMVTHDGMVKLLDFGIAKLVEDEADATTSVIFTPEYAAPEQRSGQAVTTATDVHALGIVLHELLLGTRPAGSPTQRPSARIDAPRGASEPATLRRLLRGDLDNVLLRALEAEPERRYASAGAFADDLQRHLDGQPVAAHPPSRVYRARKFVARHRGGVLVVASLVLAVLASLVVAVWQMNVARREAQRAEAESRRAGAQAARAEHVKEFLLGLFRGLDPDIAPERRPTLARIFEDGIGGLRSDASIDARLRTELLTIAGDVLFRSGERQRGLDLVGEAVASAQAQLPADAEESLKAIATLSDLDFLDSRVDVARSRLLAAIERAGTGASAGRIALLVELGLVERRRGDLAAAVDRLEQAAAMRTAAAVAADSTLGVLVDTELAYLYYLSARFSDAARLQQPLLARLRARHGDDHAPAMRLMGDYADTLARIGRDREAVDLLLASGRFMRRTQPAPNETLGVWLDSLGTAYLDQGLLQPAARAYAESVATLTARFGADDIQVLGSRAALARTRALLGEAAPAQRELEHLLALQGQKLGPTHPRTLSLRLQLAQVMLLGGDAASAVAQAGEALAATERRHGRDDYRTMRALVTLARARAAAGDTGAARADAARAVAIARTKLAPGDRSRTEALLALAEVQADANAAATLAELLDGIALAPEPMTWQELRAHERLAAITADPGESAREHATTRHLRARLAAEESEALARLNGWLADGPAYR